MNRGGAQGGCRNLPIIPGTRSAGVGPGIEGGLLSGPIADAI
jgi:hypothetical protein